VYALNVNFRNVDELAAKRQNPVAFGQLSRIFYRGSASICVAQRRCCTTLAVEDSQLEALQLDGPHEQAILCPLPHDELASYSAALRNRGSLLIWLNKDMTWLAPHDFSPARPAVFSDATIQFCLTIKVLFKLPLRQTTGMVAILLKLANLDWPVPDYTTLCRRQKTLTVRIPYRRADGPLNLLVDSTGIKFLGGGEWQAR
jgi:hypothetical protein